MCSLLYTKLMVSPLQLPERPLGCSSITVHSSHHLEGFSKVLRALSKMK